MRLYIAILVSLLCLAPALAVEQPNANQDRPAYPTLTMQGLEDLQLGQLFPATITYPGLTTKAFQEEDWEEGRRVLRSTHKLYHNGFYLGRALLDNQKRVVEIEIVDWRVAFEGEFAPASSWGHVRACLTDVNLHYADMLDALVAESPELPGLQVHYAPEAYRVAKKLKGDFTPLNLAELPVGARAQKLRLFWVPAE